MKSYLLSDLFRNLKRAIAEYPPQFWLLFFGMLISAIGVSMVWPFLTIYIHQRLGIPLTTVGLLFALHSGAGLVSTSVAGPVADVFGRKGVMVASRLVAGLTFVAMSTLDTLPSWAVLMAIRGAFNPLFRVGADAMVADLVQPERRAGAYALLRMGNNLGIAIGPAIGGFVAVASYTRTFFIAAGANVFFTLLILLFMTETLPQQGPGTTGVVPGAGYGRILRDGSFLAFCGLYTVAVIPATLLMTLLPVYAKENFGVPENQYGFIMATNAAMVVLFQYITTQLTQRYPSLPMLAAGALFYAMGTGSVALGGSFPAFWLSMVVLTIGEMILVPTGTTLAANLAPPDMRGRYMGVFSLAWWISFGVGPLIGGFLNDSLAPVAIWYGGLLMGLVATFGFVLMSRRQRVRAQEPA